MSIKLIKNVKVILDYWVTLTDLGMITKPSPLPVCTGRAPLTTRSELHHRGAAPTSSTWRFRLLFLYWFAIIIFPAGQIINRLGPDTEKYEKKLWLILFEFATLSIRENQVPRTGLETEVKGISLQVFRQDFKEQIYSPLRSLSGTDSSGFERQVHASDTVYFHYYGFLRRKIN